MRHIYSTYKEHYKALIFLGLPIVIGQIGVIVLGFADTLMIGHHLPETQIGRHHYPCHKCSEQCMNTNNLGQARRNNKNEQNKCHECFIDCFPVGIYFSYLLQKRTNYQKHDCNIHNCQSY